MTDKEAMQMALETAEQIASADYRHWGELASLGEFERWARSRANHIAEALRARLAQPEPAECDGGQCGIGGYCKQCPKTQLEQEPVGINKVIIDSIRDSSEIVAPPKREWVGLTREELAEIAEFHFHGALSGREFYDDVEAKLKEKNT